MFAFKKAGGAVMRDAAGEPLERGAGVPTPCASCPKVPQWAKKAGYDWPELKERAAELSDRHRDTLAAYRRMKAVSRFPEDELVEWYSGLIRQQEDEADAARVARAGEATVTLLGLMPELIKRRV